MTADDVLGAALEAISALDTPDTLTAAERFALAQQIHAGAALLTAFAGEQSRQAVVQLTAEGNSRRTVAGMLGVSVARVQQLLASEHARTWGPKTIAPPDTGKNRRELEEYRIARHAQVMRAENVCMGYREETEAYFGRGGNAQQEQPYTWAQVLRERAGERVAS